MSHLDALSSRWNDVAVQLIALGPMRSGSLCAQRVKHETKQGVATVNGPYPILTAKLKGKTHTLRLESAEQAEIARQQIDHFRQFQQLTKELVQIGREMADLEMAHATGGKKNSSNASKRSAKGKRRQSSSG